jgi:hypothetical protein
MDVLRLKRAFVGVVIGLGFSFALATPAFAYANTPQIATNTSTTPPGGQLLVTGENFVPNELITLVLHSTPVTLGTTTSTATGTFSTEVTIPADTTPGAHTIVATGASGDFATTDITVAATTPIPVTATSSGLAFTGADIAALSGVGAVALALGGMLILAGRRRRTTP